jgi:anti-sigma factor RsiW
MLCEEIENEILDCQENQLSPARREEVETHLAGCAGCRTFARQLQQLDVELSGRIKIPALSADFNRQLRERIQAAPASMSEAQRAERKRQLQAEFEAGMARIARGSFEMGCLLEHLTRAALAAVAGWLAWHFTAQMMAHFHSAQSVGALIPNLLPWLAASAVFLAVGLVEAFSRQSRFLRLW